MGAGMPALPGVVRKAAALGGVQCEMITPSNLRSNAVMLYLHGGGFVLGSAHSHRALTTRLAEATGAAVYAPDYRLAPEHPYPAAHEDCLACYRALLGQGIPAHQIVVAGDSAGGALAVATALRARAAGLPQPAGLMLMSPATTFDTNTASHRRYRWQEPMLRAGWLKQLICAFDPGHESSKDMGLHADLTGLAPMLIQVGEIEALQDNATGLAKRARAHGVHVDLEIYEGLWHVFQLQARELKAARVAIDRLAARFVEFTAG
jgi:acetyl esterase/lipase